MEDGLYISLDPLNDPKSCTYKLKVKEYDEYMCEKSYLGKEWVSLSTEYPTREDFSNIPVDMADEFSLIQQFVFHPKTGKKVHFRSIVILVNFRKKVFLFIRQRAQKFRGVLFGPF